MPNPIKVIDLFAGPGGLGEGFAAAGPDENPYFKISVSVEKEQSAHQTLTLRAFTREFENRTLPTEYYQYIRGEITKTDLIDEFPEKWEAACRETLGRPVALGEDNELIHAEIANALGKNNEPWVLIGGPPCQAYSLVGRARNKGIKGYTAEGDHRHTLYKEYLDIIAKFSPAVFVMENVKGILSSKLEGKQIFDQILSDLGKPAKGKPAYRIYSLSTPPKDLYDLEYAPRDFIIRAEEFGIPQCRHRVILLGVREDFHVNPEDILLSPKSAPKLSDVIGRMPKLRSGLSKNDSIEDWIKTANLAASQASKYLKGFVVPGQREGSRGARFIKANTSISKDLDAELSQWLSDKNIGGVVNHNSRGHMQSDIGRYQFVSGYGKVNGNSPKLSNFPEEFLPQHKNVDSGKFVDRFKVQLAGRPATTITSHISKDGHYFIHYDPVQCRSLTVREAARIQTFPDNYFFEGNRTQQYVQVGNAVPPFLALMIALKVNSIFS